MKFAFSLLTLSLLPALAIATTELPDRQTELPAVKKSSQAEYLVPRDLSTVPDDEFGRQVKHGYSLFVNSQQMRGQYVGNDQNCVNCHMQAGRKPNAAPLWAAYMAYPAYRKKNDRVNSYADRIQGCFQYSMNGKPPEYDSPELVALSAYAYWLAMGGLMDQYGLGDQPVPTLDAKQLQTGGKIESFPLPDVIAKALPVEKRGNLAGRGYPKLANPEQAPSRERGADVYAKNCSTCHAADGQGMADATGRSYIPPLWGEYAYNWGAGMHRINTAAFFIYENMPLGKSVQLTVQEAWDVAAYVNSHERPQDPRYKGDLDANLKQYHAHDGFYGKTVEGYRLGSKAFPSGTVN
ncbi:c-type cytochrome [Vibrio fluvialis]|uniref:c-type cytochrome n=1 Tax=Vibrio fluvialis TaxID=676 RepID=UPI001C9C867E|nr:c-type cytochrome [Vibrio fluvialis]MBY7960622.1 c-type cytochrome [Vibrio fluvialis]MBY7964262.1 c-type cytochrome [Vibrio fluvialis]MBY8075688.1 c-type cytochrome [Vibrio fluvialis]WMN54499.1 c-type cytochrome [Vibrio fluvialis]